MELLLTIFTLFMFYLIQNGKYKGQSSTVKIGQQFWYCEKVLSPAGKDISISMKLVGERMHEML